MIKKTRTELERQAGALQVKRNMAEGLIEQIQTELDPRFKFTFHLISEGPDIRKWGVRVEFAEDIAHAENFFLFPSDELKAKILLLGG